MSARPSLQSRYWLQRDLPRRDQGLGCSFLFRTIFADFFDLIETNINPGFQKTASAKLGERDMCRRWIPIHESGWPSPIGAGGAWKGPC